MVWGLSPIVGFFACPILGSLSDVCTSKLGRRRPFIIIYSIGILFGLFLTGYGHVIGGLVSSSHVCVVIVTIIGVVLLDFDCDACQSPARAYLIDISQNSDHSLGLSMFTVMAGAGGAIGYVLGGIPWAEISQNVNIVNFNNLNVSNIIISNKSEIDYDESSYSTDLAYNHKKILFTFVAAIYVLCALISITSFKEIPMQNSCSKMPNKEISYEQMIDDHAFNVTFEDIPAHGSSSMNETHSISNAREKNNLDHLETLKYYLESIVKMPKSLRWLCLTHGLCWMSLLCYSLYFTDFVGEEIYGKYFKYKFKNEKL